MSFIERRPGKGRLRYDVVTCLGCGREAFEKNQSHCVRCNISNKKQRQRIKAMLPYYLQPDHAEGKRIARKKQAA